VLIRSPVAEPSRMPAQDPIIVQAVSKARRPGRARSNRKTVETPYSPDAANPWSARSSVRRIGAIMPIDANVGRKAIRVVGTAISVIERMSAGRRPYISPTLTDEDTAQRPRQKSDGENAKRGNQAREMVFAGEELVGKDGREIAVDGEVVLFECVADRPGQP